MITDCDCKNNNIQRAKDFFCEIKFFILRALKFSTSIMVAQKHCLVLKQSWIKFRRSGRGDEGKGKVVICVDAHVVCLSQRMISIIKMHNV